MARPGLISNLRNGMAATLRGMAGVLANADMTFWRYGTRTGNAPYLDRVRERPYQYHTWVYACARSIAMNISRLPQRMVEPDHGSNFLKTHEILDLLANGYTNAGIAKTLFLDIKTVEHHINSMYSKMKSIKDFAEKHPRVEAARIYLKATENSRG